MKHFCAGIVTGCGLLTAVTLGQLGAADWPQFRGHPGASVVDVSAPPTAWGDGKNIAWTAELEGRGVSSPIVVGDQVFLTSCTGPQQDRLHVICFDVRTGRRIWERQFWATGSTSCHPKTCVAAPTPASDGRRIFAFYSSNDLACLDREGRLLWFRGLTYDFPQARISLGMASSPVVTGETVVVQVEADTEAFAMGLDVDTGATRWRLDRHRRANWCSPIVWERDATADRLVVLQASNGVWVVRPRTGDLIARFDGGASTISSSAAFGDLLLVPSNGLTALKLPQSGSELETVWRQNRLRPTTCSPLVYRDRVYVISGSILKCADPHTGRIQWQLRLRGPFSSSPVAAGGHLYAFNENGVGFVVKLGQRGRIVSQNPMNETILATPALVDGGLLIRSDRHLWKIASKAK